MSTVTVSSEELKKLCVRRFLDAGVGEGHAAIAADVLIHANLRGVDSHGVIRMENYIKSIEGGGINPRPHISASFTGPVTAVVDGDDGLGHVIVREAMEHAVRLCRENGVGMVAVINSSHCGALSYFIQRALDAGFIGAATTNTDKIVVPYGGSHPFFGTNPFAFGFPARRNRPVILDMATSQIAYGKVLQAQMNNCPIPEDCAVDRNGRSITDPHRFFALMPFGGAKGYGISMAVDIFAGILTGSAFGPHVKKYVGNYSEKRKLGHFVVALDPARYTDPEAFLDSMDRLIDEIHEVPPAPGSEGVLVPGEPENNMEEVRAREGIPLETAVYAFLTNKGGRAFANI